VILDELSYAKKILENKTEYPKLKNVIILAKYFSYLGYKPAQIKRELFEYCHRNDPYFNDVVQGWKIKIGIREMRKYRIRVPISIPITEEEIKAIKSVKDRISQELLFVLLVMAKFLKYSNTKIKPSGKRTIGVFYVNETSRNLFKMIDSRTRKKERERIEHSLCLLGLINRNRKYPYIINFASEISNVVFMVEDYSNIVLYWKRFLGYPIIGCSCGKLFFKRTSRKICPDCWKKQRLEKKREWAKNTRQRGQLPDSR